MPVATPHFVKIVHLFSWILESEIEHPYEAA